MSRRKCGRTFTVLNARISLTETWNSFCEVSVMWQHFKLHCLVKCGSSGRLFRQQKDFKTSSQKYASIYCKWRIQLCWYMWQCASLFLCFISRLWFVWSIYDTFADENLCRQNYEVYWMKHNSVLCWRVFRQVEQRFPQWSSAFGGLNFAYIVCDIVIFPSYGIGLHLESADKQACEYTYTVLSISLINLEFYPYQTC